MAKPKPRPDRTPGQIMADTLSQNLDKAISEATATRNALENVTGAAASDATALLTRAIKNIEEAKARARHAFENDWLR